MHRDIQTSVLSQKKRYKAGAVPKGRKAKRHTFVPYLSLNCTYYYLIKGYQTSDSLVPFFVRVLSHFVSSFCYLTAGGKYGFLSTGERNP